ncbi:hypothetical protein [Streptomyces sp. Z26]|uniref:hypothetical protein n=1 Tax=Streptomyces TaxID=1883 RepID=UPI000EF14347|nr:hypothetical protein [Streptomyces sp. Z26]RLL66633.1 hypothetical protein D7M15_06800 [Streptomyces sp. Z26]
MHRFIAAALTCAAAAVLAVGAAFGIVAALNATPEQPNVPLVHFGTDAPRSGPSEEAAPSAPADASASPDASAPADAAESAAPGDPASSPAPSETSAPDPAETGPGE